MKAIVAIAVLLCVLGMPVLADWEPTEAHKMHYPQLPDPNGWDVRFDGLNRVADDWQCTESGPVTEIHFWASWQADIVGGINSVHARIYSDQPEDEFNPFSHPKDELWESTFLGPDLAIRDAGSGDQGWYDPNEPGWNRPDHSFFYQVNIENIIEPFEQVEGTIYWLELEVASEGGMIGWKTSQDHFNDDSVYWETGIGWMELIDPVDGTTSLDQAFVIVPEPLSAAFAMGAVALLLLCRRLFHCNGT
jgi:hypothetical protein